MVLGLTHDTNNWKTSTRALRIPLDTLSTGLVLFLSRMTVYECFLASAVFAQTRHQDTHTHTCQPMSIAMSFLFLQLSRFNTYSAFFSLMSEALRVSNAHGQVQKTGCEDMHFGFSLCSSSRRPHHQDAITQAKLAQSDQRPATSPPRAGHGLGPSRRAGQPLSGESG